MRSVVFVMDAAPTLEGAGVGTEPSFSAHGASFFLWTETLGYSSLGEPRDLADVQLDWFSADGKAVLGEVMPNSQTSTPFLRTESRGYTPLASLPNWPTTGLPQGLSSDGTSIFGTSQDGRLFRWRESGMQWLGSFTAYPDCIANLISADGEVISCSCGASVPPPQGGPMRSFRWTEASGMLALDPSGAVQLGPIAMSASGDVIGTPYLNGTQASGLASWTSSQGIAQLLGPSGVAGTTPVLANPQDGSDC